jgi:L-lactate dehydrogenase complex protein LldG
MVSGEPEDKMSARDAILDAVRKNLPRPAVPLPDDPGAGRQGVTASLGYSQHFHQMPEVQHSHDMEGCLVSNFKKQLEGMGGRWFEVADAAAAQAKLAELFPAAKVVCSAVPDVPGNRRVETVSDPHALDDVDVGVVRSHLAVSEAGAVWLTQNELVVTALGVLSQHLVVLLDPAVIVETMHDAYARLDLPASPYGVFMAGPSATGDIEGTIIHGAQGARSLTVFLMRSASKTTA